MRKVIAIFFLLFTLKSSAQSTISVSENDFDKMVEYIKKKGSAVKYSANDPHCKYKCTVVDEKNTFHAIYLIEHTDQPGMYIKVQSYINGRDMSGYPFFFWEIRRSGVMTYISEDGKTGMENAVIMTKETSDLRTGYPVAKRCYDILLQRSK